MNDHRARGQQWERTAELFLHGRGLKTLKKNYRCKLGEIDLVMMDGRTLVFTEVKYRRRGSHGSGAESVNRRKQQRIIRAASCFLKSHRQHPAVACRFDVISIDKVNGVPALNWIRSAFTA